MSWPNHGYTGAVLPRPSIRSIRPLDRCCSTAYSSAMRTGSLVVISVVAVDTISLLVVAAMNDSRVVGADEKKGGLWCSPMANTSSPTSSVFWAIRTIASIRSASLGVVPDTGSRVMSLTENTPNCMQAPSRPSAPALDVLPRPGQVYAFAYSSTETAASLFRAARSGHGRDQRGQGDPTRALLHNTGTMTPGHRLPYDVNCSILFSELPLLERPAAARAAGFGAIELWWPFADAVPGDGEVDALVRAVEDAGVRLVGLNFAGGDLAAGDRGLLSWPERAAEFRANLEVAVGIGERLG